MTITEPETAQAPPGAPQSVFVDGNFDSSPGTPGTHTAHGLPPTINRIRRDLQAEGAPLKKLMVANRGVSDGGWAGTHRTARLTGLRVCSQEIAIRIFRTAVSGAWLGGHGRFI